MSSRLTSEILAHWGASRGPIKLGGLSPSSTAWLICCLLEKPSEKILLICPDDTVSTRVYQDLKTFFLQKNLPEESLDFFPGWEQSPYLSFSPSIKNRIRRLRTLYRIQSGLARCVVTDVISLSQRCPSAESIIARSFQIKPGEFFERGGLISKLEAAGYQRRDPVEDPGTYAVRGGIVDLFSPSLRKPLRLEFFGDELESIRAFDPGSQKSDPAPLGAAEIIPVTDFAWDADALTRARTSIKEFCDGHGISKKSRDEFMEALSPGHRDPTLDYLFPFATDMMSGSLIDQLEGSWRIATWDSLSLDSEFDAHAARMKQEFERSVAEGRVAASPELLFIDAKKMQESLMRASLRLDAMAIGVPVARPEDEDEAEAAKHKTLDDSGSGFLRIHKNEDLKGTGDALDSFYSKTAAWASRGFTRAVFCSTTSQTERVHYLCSQHSVPAKIVEKIDWSAADVLQIIDAQLSGGFRIASESLAIVTDSELFGPKKQRTKRPEKQFEGMGTFVSSLEDLEPNDFVVHLRHGVGRYHGLTKIEVDKIPQDFLLLEYAGNDKLYLPVYRLDQVQKYLGAEGASAAILDKLGSGAFEKTKERVKAELEDLAAKLLELYAQRAARQGHAYGPPDEHYRAFEARFPYAETPDQNKAIEDVLDDMESAKIMDRLVCGDVGYGKTEVAMRAAYRAVLDGKQVAVLVPTTVLALQHERSFRERFRDTPAKIGALSRFKTSKEIKDTLASLKAGELDVVIGTHRLLSKDVAFKSLGLVVVDEEQRFGVEHKERLKALKLNTDILTLTATPIPRTLQLSLMGMRDISVINTAPVDRLSVRTYVSKLDDETIARAIRQEIARGGQVFFLHNRVQSIHAMADRLKAIVPEARIIVAHGQLDEKALEERMLEFYNKKGDILLCSTIIESGLDIPSANTIIINRADMFGLSQLYQLRGRVGRSQARAYCYLLLPEEGAVTEDAKKRLEVIQRFVELGSGFKIASHDLELRGGGDILGKNQSGHIAAIGYELFMEMLEETINELKGKPAEDRFDPEIKLPMPAILPEVYVPDVHQRLGLYKRLSDTHNADELHSLELEMEDRYGKPPTEVQNLFWLIRLKQLLRTHHIKALVCGKERVSIDAGSEAKLSPQKMLGLVQKHPGRYSLTPDSKIVIKLASDSAQRLFHEVHDFLEQVADPNGA